MKFLTYTDLVVPKHSVFRLPMEFLITISFSAVLAFSSKISFFLPFTPIPITLQTFVVLFGSILLGKRRSVMGIGLYILEGALGFPVFSKGGGVLYLLGPTGGYVLGFLYAGYVVGLLAEKGFDRKMVTSIFMMVMGNAIIYFFGAIWLSKFISFTQIFAVGILPFLIGDICKIIFASVLLPFGWHFIKAKQDY